MLGHNKGLFFVIVLNIILFTFFAIFCEFSKFSLHSLPLRSILHCPFLHSHFSHVPSCSSSHSSVSLSPWHYFSHFPSSHFPFNLSLHSSSHSPPLHYSMHSTSGIVLYSFLPCNSFFL